MTLALDTQAALAAAPACPGTLHLEPGERLYCGYHEWAVHPDEAAVIIARGHVTINGRAFRARQMDTIGGCPLIRVEGLPGDPSDPRAQQALHEALS